VSAKIQVCMLLAVGSNSITWLDTGNIVTNVKNFPHRRGAVTGILKCCFGLSSAIFSLLYVAIFHNNSPASVLLLSALLTTTACLLGLPFIQLLTPAKLQEDSLRNKSSFICFYVILIAFTLYLLAAALLNSTGFTNSLATQVMACGILLFLGAPLFFPFLISQFGHNNSSVVVRDQPFLLPCQHEGDLRVHDFLETQNSSDAPAMKMMAAGDDDEVAVMKVLEEEDTAGEETIVMQQLHGGDHDDESEFSLMRAVRKLDFWLLFFSFLIGAGTAVTAQNNLGQLGEAQSLTNVTVYVSLIGTMSSLGRLGGGVVSDYGVRLAGIPRPIWMAIAHGGLLIGHLLFARALPGSMYAASILTGLCSGIQWTVIGPTISELFGLKHFGLIYSTICTASALGSLLFSSLVGHLYDHECQRETYIGNTVLLTKKAAAVLSFSSSSSSFSRLTLTNSFLQKAAAAETTCLAAHCFKLAFFIMAVVCLVGVFINLTLAARTQNLYQSLHKLHSSTTTFSDDDDDDYDCEVKCDSDPILPH
jgi:hypothetical protein